MSHFYGTLQGQKGEAARCGSASSGLTTTAASWKGAIQVRLFTKDGVDMFDVVMIPWHGAGDAKVIASGRVGDAGSVEVGR